MVLVKLSDTANRHSQNSLVFARSALASLCGIVTLSTLIPKADRPMNWARCSDREKRNIDLVELVVRKPALDENGHVANRVSNSVHLGLRVELIAVEARTLLRLGCGPRSDAALGAELPARIRDAVPISPRRRDTTIAVPLHRVSFSIRTLSCGWLW